jgi:hypothetical protein
MTEKEEEQEEVGDEEKVVGKARWRQREEVESKEKMEEKGEGR